MTKLEDISKPNTGKTRGVESYTDIARRTPSVREVLKDAYFPKYTYREAVRKVRALGEELRNKASSSSAAADFVSKMRSERESD